MIGARDALRWEPLTEAHVTALFDRPCPYLLKGVAFYWCDKLAGIGGVALQQGRWVAFSDIDGAVTVPDIAVWRCAKLVVREIVSKMTVPVYAEVAPSSHKWAKLLGFEQIDEEVFAWPIHSAGPR